MDQKTVEEVAQITHLLGVGNENILFVLHLK